MKLIVKKRFNSLVTAGLFSFVCLVSNHALSQDSDTQKAPEIAGTETNSEAVQSLKQKLELLKTYTAMFEQTVVDGQGELVQNASGQLTLKQPNLMIWQVNEPDENLMVADGATLWYSDPFVEQVTAVDQTSSVANNPVVLLTDPENQAWDAFVISRVDEGFMVSAKEPESQVAQLFLKFDNDTLTALHFVDRQQQTSRLVFSDIRQNLPIGDEQFVFSVPDGFELDDQR
ncbi:MAG: outer membrane lipoprotein chaperone LolA [Aliiglaciecola sp.]